VKLIFTPTDPEDARTCEVFGVEFAAGEAVDVSGLPQSVQGKLKANPQFAEAPARRARQAD